MISALVTAVSLWIRVVEILPDNVSGGRSPPTPGAR